MRTAFKAPLLAAVLTLVLMFAAHYHLYGAHDRGLLAAVRDGNARRVRAILEKGRADPNARDEKTRPAIWLAVIP